MAAPEFASPPARPRTKPSPSTSETPLTAPLPEWQLQANVGICLAASLHQRWQAYREQLCCCKQHFSERNVHELRVASRRLIAQCLLMTHVTQGGGAEKAQRLLKQRLKALGELRDTHVQRLAIERQMEHFPELVLLRDSLRRREGRLERAASAELRHCRTRKLARWISELCKQIALRATAEGEPDTLSREVAQATAEAFAEVVRRRQAIDPSVPDTIHRTRIAFKKFRYIVESLSPDLTGLTRNDLRPLAQYQRKMGNLQDLEVMQRFVADYIRKQTAMRALMKPFQAHLQTMRRRALGAFLKSADRLLDFWPAVGQRPSDQSTPALNAA